MTVSVTSPKQGYSGNGSTTVFNIPFEFFDQSEIQVITRVVSTGVETIETNGGAYTVTGIDIPNGIPGTDVTFGTAPASGVQVWVCRVLPRTQTMDLANGVATPQETYEVAYDRAVMLVQELEEEIARTPKFKKTTPSANNNMELPEPEAGKYLVWNDTADGIENTDVIGVQADLTGIGDNDLIKYDAALEEFVPVPAASLGVPIGSLTPVDINTPVAGDTLQFDGANWINSKFYRSGRTVVSTNTHSKHVDFATPMASVPVVTATLFNDTDGDPLMMPLTVTFAATTGFTVSWPGFIDSDNYILNWIAIGGYDP